MDGIIPLWKEKGMTSFDCVFQVRKLLKMKRVGHSGTLDPQVDGVLPICIGKATKVVEFLLESEKAYQGEICLGISTETEDAYGDVVEQVALNNILRLDLIDDLMKDMEGTLQQVPPMYSAVKVDGKRLYEYARKGQEVTRPIRQVEIYSFVRTGQPIYHADNQTVTWPFEVHCSKGTYIRTLAVDLGKKLGFPAHMSQLTRIKSASYQKEDCLTLAQLKELVASDRVKEAILPIETALDSFEKVDLSSELFDKVKHGALLEESLFQEELTWPVAFYYQGNLIALYHKHAQKEGLIKPYKMF
ncbi:tRNA pseudouridine(55) synthase TruB [Granulicatella seriolae]|uniref:tRNA pseudouridine synthase B n=1 Tax=Granulicatella seriolae TaxID=2967226 RepID=A0ABT1WKT9_9LACT|nr:tRNA pseudouridine(55) synthase TruB [Granulicatella seriolae]